MIEVKAGYKQTEIGVIPEDWEVVVFENIADKSKKWSITGGPFGSNLKASDYTNDGVQIIQLQNIGDGNFIDDYQIFTSEEKANELLSCNIYPNEIILSKMGDPVARACFMPIKAKRYLMASDGIRLVVNEKDFSKKFIHDYINSIYFRKRAFEISTGSTRLRIGLPELKSLLVIKPPKSEQNAIATILSDTDALIERLERLIAKKKAIKQGAMQQLLTGKKKLPGFEIKKGYKQTELGVIPEDWDVKSVQELLENRVIIYHMDGNHGELYPRSNEFTDFGVPYIAANDFRNGDVDFDQCKKLPIEKATKFKKGISINGDVLFAHNATVGPVAILRTKLDYVILSTSATCFRCDNRNLLNKYLQYFFESHFFVRQYSAVMSQSTRNQVPITTQRKFYIIIPAFSDQNAIATILSDMEAEIEALEQKRDKYTMIKQGMMQQLLTGRIRIHGTK